jgi:hypothetical protein
MKRTVYLCGIAFLVSAIVFLGLASSVKAPIYPPPPDESDVWSEPNGYAHAYVIGSWYRVGYPYYTVHHEADIFECLKGRYHFIGYGKGVTLYSVWGVMQNGVMHAEYDPGLYYQIWGADTETWAPYSSPPNPYMEYAHALIGPPGSV